MAGPIFRVRSIVWKAAALIYLTTMVVYLILNKKKNIRGVSLSKAGAGLQLFEIPSTGAKIRSVLVSYVVYAPNTRKDEEWCRQCKYNTDTFILRSVTCDERVRFLFTLVGKDTTPTSKLRLAQETFRNVDVRTNRVVQSTDLHVHGEVLRNHLSRAEYFVLLNCGARGPYYDSTKGGIPNLIWMEAFLTKFTKDVRAVGATISCEISPHVQTYAIAIDREAARIIMPLWTNGTIMEGKTKLAVIASAEVGASQLLLSHGYNIACLDSRHEGVDFRTRVAAASSASAASGGSGAGAGAGAAGSSAAMCDPEFKHLSPLLLNPIACRGDPYSPGCQGLDPCEVAFVKTGGEILRLGLVPGLTDSYTRFEDHRVGKIDKPEMCVNLNPRARAFIDIPKIFDTLDKTFPPFHRQFGTVEETAQLAIIVRTHSSYAVQLMTLILMLEAMNIQEINLLMIIIPTDYESITVIKKSLDDLTLLKSMGFRVNTKVFEAPKSLYDKYGALINKLCTPGWKERFLEMTYKPSDVDRFCNINSPLHYTLVDIALHYVKVNCPTCRMVLTTNADNYYSSRFFTNVIKSFPEYDVVMSNMISKGEPYTVELRRGRIDLGSYAVSVDFLRKTNTQFLNSIPIRSQARDYHDADGHFIERLVAYKARVKHINETYFFHN